MLVKSYSGLAFVSPDNVDPIPEEEDADLLLSYSHKFKALLLKQLGGKKCSTLILEPS